MLSQRVTRTAVIGAVMGLVAGGAVALGLGGIPAARAMSPASSPAVAVSTTSTLTLPDFSAIVRQYGPAVVNVSTTGTTKTAMDFSGAGRSIPAIPSGSSSATSAVRWRLRARPSCASRARGSS